MSSHRESPHFVIEVSPVLELADRIENERSFWIAFLKRMTASGERRKEMRFEFGFTIFFVVEESGSMITVYDEQGHEASVIFSEVYRDPEVGGLTFDEFLEGFMVFLQLREVMVLSDLGSVMTPGGM